MDNKNKHKNNIVKREKPIVFHWKLYENTHPHNTQTVAPMHTVCIRFNFFRSPYPLYIVAAVVH